MILNYKDIKVPKIRLPKRINTEFLTMKPIYNGHTGKGYIDVEHIVFDELENDRYPLKTVHRELIETYIN